LGKLVERGKSARTGVHIEIEYAPPFALLDSSAPPPYIRPNALAVVQNALLVDNQYVASSTTVVNSIGGGSPALNYTNLGLGDLDGVVFSAAVNSGVLSVYTLGTGIFGGSPVVPVLMGSFVLDGGVTLGALTYININGVCFFSFAGADNIYQHNNSGASVLSSYLGAAYLAELNGRLLALNVTQKVVSTITNFPYQIAWSAPGGAYSQFNPLVGGLVTGAGFNNLPDVEDVITGVFTTGPTGYILRRQGITEISPLNSGIQPFDFNHLWASHKGIGTVYPGSVAQYGSFGAFIADDDFYTVGYDGINVFAGYAKTALYTAIAAQGFGASVNVRSILCPILLNGNPELCYIMMISGQSVTSSGFSLYIYNFTTKEWSFLNYPGAIVLGASFWIASVIADGYAAYNTPGILISAFVNPTSGPNFTNFFSINPVQVLSGVSGNTTILTFPAEEVLFGRDVTVDGLLLYISGTAGTIVNLTVSNILIGSIAYGNSGSPIVLSAGRNLYFAYPLPTSPSTTSLPFTGKFPQLSISVQGVGTQSISIGKVSMFCTIDPTQRII
jgi:hypothetical protein